MPKDKKPKVVKKPTISTRIVLTSTREDDFRVVASIFDLSEFVARVEDYCFERNVGLSGVNIQFAFDSITAVIEE